MASQKSKQRNLEMLNKMSKDPSNWKGPFYLNPKDPRLIVPKIVPEMGWTFNFACPYTYIFIVAVILIIISSKYFI